MCLPAVEVDSVAVDLPAQTVAEPVAEVVAVACSRDIVACNPVHLPPLQLTAGGERGLDGIYGGVSAPDDRVEDTLVLLRNQVADVGRPGDVGEHGVVAVEPRPQVDQQPVSRTDRRRALGGRLVMGVRRVLVYRHHGPVGHLEPALYEHRPYHPSDVVLGDA